MVSVLSVRTQSLPIGRRCSRTISSTPGIFNSSEVNYIVLILSGFRRAEMHSFRFLTSLLTISQVFNRIADPQYRIQQFLLVALVFIGWLRPQFADALHLFIEPLRRRHAFLGFECHILDLLLLCPHYWIGTGKAGECSWLEFHKLGAGRSGRFAEVAVEGGQGQASALRQF